MAGLRDGVEQWVCIPIEITRHLLHAWKLGLRHPVTGEMMKWEAPMPKDMEEFINKNK